MKAKMECQSRLELEKTMYRLKQEASTGWLENNMLETNAIVNVIPTTTQRQNKPLNEYTLTQMLLDSGNTQDFLSHLIQTVGEAVQAECCFFGLQANSRTTSQIAHWSAKSAKSALSPSSSAALGHFLNHVTVQSTFTPNKPLVITNWPTFVRSHLSQSRSSKRGGVSSLPQEPQIKAVLALKTQFQGQINGMLVLTRSQPCKWKESEVQLLKLFSSHVAVAASQLHLEQQVQQQIRYQTLINELTTAIRNAWELDRIFQMAVEGTASVLQVTRGMILLFKYVDPLHRNRPTQQIPQARANVAAEWQDEALIRTLNLTQQTPGEENADELNSGKICSDSDRSFWASSCSLCQQLLTGNLEPIVLPACDLPLEDEIMQRHWNGSIASIFCLEMLPALLLVPLENQGTVLGCLVFQHPQRLWSLEDITLVKLAAAQISTAIIQSRTLQQIQAVVQERTAQLQHSLDVQAKLYEKTRQQVEQLRRLNTEREEFLSTISHELRTPLTSMTLAIRMLRQADLSPERRDKYLNILEQQCIQETQLINDLLALRKLETNSTTAQLQKLDIRYLVRDIAQSIETHLATKNLSLDLDLPTKPLTLYTESDSFNRILTELLTNAYKYSDPDSHIQLQVIHDSNPTVSQVILMLKNTGAGISPDELPYIFDKFRRGQGVTKQAIQGTGLGLALVKRLVEHLGGTIAATSQPDQSSQPSQPGTSWQTCFTVTFPQYPEGILL